MDLKPVTGELLYGDDLRQPRKFSWPLQHGKPRLLSEAKENGEGARLPHVKSLKKTRGESIWKKKLPCDRLPVDHGFIRIFTVANGAVSPLFYLLM
ncbi:MAG: hypothetical protein DRH15_12590 [Deltaproteobacteria bacterium]|nr:MAG: hypothetical protein DRH15_12590 [Deltaproteobacteria bacterium]